MNIEAHNPDRGASARQLAAAAEPVFVFDGRVPVLVWANQAALAFVGHADVGDDGGAPRTLPHLDRAMPAMSRLRALSGETIAESGIRLDLVFWTGQGARTLTCDCRRASFAFAPEALIVHGSPAHGRDAVKFEAEPPTEGRAAAKKDAKSRLPARRKGRGKTRTGRKAPKVSAARPSIVDATQKSSGAAVVVASPSAAQALAVALPTLARTEMPSPLPLPASAPVAIAAAVATRQRLAELKPPLPPRSPVVPPAPVRIDAPARHETTGDTFALREIARQIQSATSAHFAARARGAETSAADAEAPPATRTGAPQPDMLSQIGHEIRTPLSSILGFAEIMRDERLGPMGNARYRSYAADIHDSATHALSLINDLLDLSRLEAGGWRFEAVEIDVAATIAAAVASLQPLAEKAGVMLSAPAGRPLPKLKCDARALKQMLLNLLSNAVKHTDSGGAVWITAATDDLGGLVVRIQDTGVGMSREDLSAALEPWSQVGAAERRAGGTGLGLPLTKAMAEGNGGRLQLERIAGGGLAALLVFGHDRIVRS